MNVDLVDTVLADRYRVVRKLGEGGMGSVYLAEHTTINKKLAIKVLSPEFSHKQDLVDRFLQEARAASMIDQENVVEITDFGSTPNGSVFFVMEYLQGEDLSDTIKREGPQPWPRVRRIMLQIVEALKCAHAAGIVHRDMKPENCFRIRRGSNEDFIKVLDFGIAKVTSDEGDGAKNLTRTGMIFGTPEYMSPEQAKGEKVDHRVDVYALGIILYELLTGRVPFTADTFMGILTKHMFEPPAAPSTVVPHANIPEQVEAIILKALQKDREYRFQDMADMGAAIEAVGTDSAAVSVVNEMMVRPAGGETSFKNRPLNDKHAKHAKHDEYDEYDETAGKPKTGLFIGLGLAAAVVVGGLGFAFLGGGEDRGGSGDGDPVTDRVAVVGDPEGDSAKGTAAEPDQVGDDADSAAGADGGAPEDDSSVGVAVVTSAVSITVSTPGVEGTVYDNRDDSVLGTTNEPILMPLAKDSFDIYVRADGYEDFLTDVIPDKDKKVEVSLSKQAVETPTTSRKTKRGRPTPKKKKKGDATSATPPDNTGTDTKQPPPPDPKKKKKKGDDGLSSDLKNPFG